MKKFLTVLLALSVVFTYSFGTVGTAFAATTADEAAAAAVLEEQQAMAKAVNDYTAKIVYDQKGYLVSAPELGAPDANLSQVAIEYTAAEVIAEYNNLIKTAGVDAVKDGTFNTGDAAAIHEAWSGELGSEESIKTMIFWTKAGVDGILYTKAVADAKAAAIAEINAVDTSQYSEDDAEAISEAAKTALATINDAANSKAGLASIATALSGFKTLVDNKTTIVDQSAELEKFKSDAQYQVSNAAETLKANVKNRLESIVANTSASAADIADANAKLATLDADFAQVEALYNDQIAAVALSDYTNIDNAKAAVTAVKNTAFTAFWTQDNFYGVVTQLANKDLLLQYAESYATTMKNEYSPITGLATYNATTVDAALEDVKARINRLDIAVDTYEEIQVVLRQTPTAAEEKKAVDRVKDAGIRLITESGIGTLTLTGASTAIQEALNDLKGDYAKTSWDQDDQKAIEDIQDEYKLKIKAAADADAVITLVKEAQAKMDDVALRTAEKIALNADILAQLRQLNYATAKAGTGGTLADYANSKNTESQYTAATITGALQKASDVLYDAVYAEKNPELTAAQIEVILRNNYNAALAEIDKMQTKTALESAANAVISAVNALPTTASLANKDQYIAVQKMYEDYLDQAGTKEADITNNALLAAYMTRIIALEKTAVEDLIKLLPTAITVDNQAAVEAARAAVDAYDEAYSDYANYGYREVSNLSKLEAAETALSNALLVDAAKKIAALPASITEDDIADVEAARAAYDKLDDVEKAAFSTALYDKLIGAEEQVAKLEALDVEQTKLAVQGTHVKIWSSSGKGYIQIRWDQNDNGVTLDGYEVYRSTKKTSGFNKISTFKVQKQKTYKINMKKGTKYYFKVKGFKMVGDEKVYTHDSITVYRTFR